MHTTRTTRQAALAMLAVLMAILLTCSQAGNAWAATTGFDTREGTIQMTYGHDGVIDKAWDENVLTVDNEWVYCVGVDDDFAQGIEVNHEDPVATGKWSQEMTTELALAAEYVWDGKFRSSTASGSRLVTDNREKYAVTQVMVWHIMNRHGFSHHGWFGASVNGSPLTGADDGSADCMAYVEANKSSCIGHANYYEAGTAQSVACGFWTEPLNGSIELVKRSANESITKNNGCYSLKGAVYGIFEKKNAAMSRDEGKALATYKTDSKGTWSSDGDFAKGTYYVSELKAPTGYTLDESVYTVQVEPGSRVLVNADVGYVNDTPRNNPVTLWAIKQDAETADHGAQGSATLADTHFEISYYDGYYQLSNLPSAATRTWIVTCDADGKAYARDDLKIGGDDFYRTETGDITIPLGTVVVREKAAPNKYRDGGTEGAGVVQIKSSDSGKTLGVYTAPTFKNEVMRGGVIIGKVDRQSKSYVPQGAATLEGATFSIITDNAQQVLVDGTRYTAGDVVKTLGTELVDGRYVARTSDDCLPAGRYTVRETTTSQGYLYDAVSQAWEQSFEISTDGQIVDLTDPNDAVGNQAIRGDFGFSKVDGLTDARIGNVPFMVTSTTTGESHVLMADENGMASTTADWNPHARRTNANDKAVTEKNAGYAVDESLLDEEAGIWFSGSLEATSNPDDNLGALPYDTYTVTELPVKANEGYELVTFSVRISRHGRELDLGTVDDNPGPSIATSLADENGAHIVAAAESVDLVDTVHFTNLDVRQTYTLKGTLHLIEEEGEEEEGVASQLDSDDLQDETTNDTSTSDQPFAVREIIFTPKSANGSVDVAFAVDTSELGGKQLVAFEELFDARGAPVAKHADISDVDQTVRIPKIGTTLVDGADQSHETPSYGAIELVDTVTYRGLVPGIAYTMAGALHVRAADGTDAGPALDESGHPIEAVQSFTPDAPEGTTEVTFSFSAPALAGCTVVAFEELMHKGVAYAAHADIEDEGQSIRMPGIGTTLVDSLDGDHEATADEAITLVDIVSYRGVTPGVAYAVTGILHVRNSDGSDAGPALDENGDEITATETFTPENDAGETNVTFSFAAPSLAGRTVVAFEELTRDERIYAVHADIEDDEQTVWFNPPHTEEGKPPDETPPAPNPPKETPPVETPPVETPPTETPPPAKGTLPRTGDGLNPMPFALAAAAATGITAATLHVRRMQKNREITVNRGPNRTKAKANASAKRELPARDQPRTESLRRL